MNTEPTTAVSLSAVSHRYGKVQALDDVSLAIPRGQTVGLIGPDGVGKSTLLSLIAGVKIIQSGKIGVLGGDMADKDTRLALSHRIAFMPQGLGHNLYRTLSVRENIDFHARLFGLKADERGARIARLVEATGLAPFIDRAAGKLSGGMKQKLSLCCALVHSPDLLILDEPTTGVDPLSRRQFWALVNELRQENAGMTVIVATAYIEEAQQFEQLLAMDDGKLLANKPTREVLAEYATDVLEEAYIKMLPPEKQGAGSLEITPFVEDKNLPPAIEAHGLTKRFGAFTAVDHVSFTIPKGEIFGFLGSNGCGKSTTMKMLTGLLEATEGTAELLGKPVDAGDMQTKMRVGYMSQAFSLYEELSVRRNLDLHAELYQMGAKGAAAVEEALRQFDLADVADTAPASLPLGIRQRLQLAAACLHRPEVLILDEPTSGVDPAARDMFWRYLLKMSREDRMTIFVSTHFMNEAGRCDRISFMHKGRVLAAGTPEELTRARNAPDLEEAFVQYLAEAEDEANTIEANTAKEKVLDSIREDRPSENEATGRVCGAAAHTASEDAHSGSANDGKTRACVPHTPYAVSDRHSDDGTAAEVSDGIHTPMPSENTLRHTASPKYMLAMVWTFAVREAKELLHDKIRLFFALFGPVIMMAAVAWGVSFDVQNLKFAVYDRDQTGMSRELAEYFRGSRYFIEQPEIRSAADIDTVLKSAQAVLVIDIPSGFGRKLLRGEQPEVGFYIDGALPFNASNIQSYIGGILTAYSQDRVRAAGLPLPAAAAEVVPRFRYNQSFNSINAIAPGVMMLVLVMIPAMMTAIGVVREKETGSISNLYASPAGVPQYLIGKQLPYIAVGMANFAALVLMMIFWFGVPVKGSFAALSFGTLLMVGASTAMGLLVSSFVKSQLAAIFVAAIATMIPTVNYSGFLYPLSTLSGGAYAFGRIFPASWYLNVSVGTFTKGLDGTQLQQEFAAVGAFMLACIAAACLLLKKQEQ
ncbi:ABC transporter ATP-binding protein [Bergeriella denitrificans]|uniref:ABC transporter ATP-binding protein n=2 Tax=Bergeriella denitrificans TaxID=494 RepID=A0A378UE43_BERDE|nr:ribosome-associated ATPase/putative transporter RbbA [Bergeriella denitrificans]STZ75688.1 ABC transporter ATP-binding protein [Bergeriella denitrificans]